MAWSMLLTAVSRARCVTAFTQAFTALQTVILPANVNAWRMLSELFRCQTKDEEAVKQKMKRMHHTQWSVICASSDSNLHGVRGILSCKRIIESIAFHIESYFHANRFSCGIAVSPAECCSALLTAVINSTGPALISATCMTSASDHNLSVAPQAFACTHKTTCNKLQ